MAKVLFARLCKEIKKNQQTGLFSLVGSFAHLRLTNSPVGFVCVVYWGRAYETFRQSFALMDQAGNLLDETPSTECVLNPHRETVSTAFFYASFPGAGSYHISVHQNGVCLETIPLQVVEASQIGDRYPPARLAPFESAAPG